MVRAYLATKHAVRAISSDARRATAFWYSGTDNQSEAIPDNETMVAAACRWFVDKVTSQVGFRQYEKAMLVRTI